jgi:phosphosulfolactate synthase
LDRSTRSRLILKGLDAGLTVYTEYGKKCWGSMIELKSLIQTVTMDIRLGADLVTIEGRESGMGVGIFDEKGGCKDEQIREVLEHIPNRHLLLWEAPQKSQQVHLIRMLGPEINLGNISAQDILALEALRRGLRSDTFVFPNQTEDEVSNELHYDI